MCFSVCCHWPQVEAGRRIGIKVAGECFALFVFSFGAVFLCFRIMCWSKFVSDDCLAWIVGNSEKRRFPECFFRAT